MSSRSYVLAEYNNQTRKIAGEWSKKSYKNLMSEIRNKFDITRAVELDIKVYDKQNNKYFSIDKYEMNEIRKGGLIRIVKSPPRKSPKSSKRGPQQQSSPMKPPGVPPYSKQDDLKRNQWKVNSRVEIYSEGQRKWQHGQIVDIFRDNEGEWLVIKYAGFRTKEIQRFSNYIRPVEKENKNKQNKQNKKDKQIVKKDVKKDVKKSEPKPKPKPKKKEAKKEKITTQSKYRKKEKVPFASTLKDNQIHIKGNSQHIKKYIDKACILLRGFDAGSKEKEKDKVTDKNTSDDDDDDKKEELIENEKYDWIELIGTGRAMGFVVSTAEIVKRIIGNLHQVTILESIQVIDVWQPLEAGLQEVETTKPVAQLRILLAINESDINTKAPGYQQPIAVDDFASNLEYHYDDDGNYKGGRGRGRGGRGGRGGKSTRGRGGGGNKGGRGGGGVDLPPRTQRQTNRGRGGKKKY